MRSMAARIVSRAATASGSVGALAIAEGGALVPPAVAPFVDFGGKLVHVQTAPRIRHLEPVGARRSPPSRRAAAEADGGTSQGGVGAATGVVPVVDPVLLLSVDGWRIRGADE